MLADRIATARAERNEAVRADPVTMEEFGYLLGAASGNSTKTKAGTVVGPRRALGLSPWYSGVRYLSESMASLPVHAYRDDAGYRSRRADPPWLTRPDIELPWEQLVEFWMMSLLHKGNAYSWKLRNAAGQVVGLRELHPDCITVGQAPDGTKRFLIDEDPTPYTTRDVLHIPGLAYNGRVGMNPIQYQADTLGGIAAADDYAGRFFGAGTHLGGIITLGGPLTKEQREATRDEWDAFHQGLVNAHKTGVLSNGSRYERISLDAASSQLIESRKYGVTEIARILRIPPHKLYDLERATFSNIEHQSIEAVVDSIRPWAVRLEAHLNFDPDLMAPGSFIEFQLEGLLRGDSAARATFYSQLINAGVMSPQTGARLENLPAPDELDYYLRPLSMAVIKPGVPEPVATDEAAQARKLSVAEAIQKVYLGVGTVLTADEARQIVNDAGGNLPVPGPPLGGPGA